MRSVGEKRATEAIPERERLAIIDVEILVMVVVVQWTRLPRQPRLSIYARIIDNVEVMDVQQVDGDAADVQGENEKPDVHPALQQQHVDWMDG